MDCIVNYLLGAVLFAYGVDFNYVFVIGLIVHDLFYGFW